MPDASVEVKKSYEASVEVVFTHDADLSLTHYEEDGVTHHRMEGIYSDVVTVDDILKHLAYNAIFNGVTDASRLDGFANIPTGALTMRVVHSTIGFEED